MTAGYSETNVSIRDDVDISGYKLLIDSVREYAIYLLDSSGRIADWSAGAASLKGYSANEIVGKPHSIFYDHEAVASGVPDQLLHTARTEGRVEAEGWRIRKDGSRFWANVVITALRDDAGHITGFAKITRDMTMRHKAEDALRSSTAIGMQVIQSVQEGIAVLDRDLRYLIWNPFLERLTGYDQSRIIGRQVLDVFPTIKQDERYSFLQKALQGEYISVKGMPMLPEYGKPGQWISPEYIPLRSQDDDVTGVIVTVRDVTELRDHEEKVARLTRIYAVLSGINSAIVRIRNRQALLQEACNIATAHGAFLTAWIGLIDEESGEGRVVAASGDKLDFFDRVQLTARTDSPARNRPANIAIRTRTPYVCNDISTEPGFESSRDELLGKGHMSMTSFPLIVEERAIGVLSLFSGETGFFDEPEMRLLNELAGDIAFGLEYIQKDERLHYLAYYDALTGLPNRTFFVEQLSKKLQATDRSTAQLAVCVGDIRRFKLINETFGRQAGDTLLKQVGQRLAKLAKNPETLSYLGASSFASIVSDITDASEVAHRIEQLLRMAASEPLVLNGEELHVAIAVGVAIYPFDGADAETLLKNAGAALENAKAGDAPYRFYESSLNNRVADVLRLEYKLSKAIEKEEFRVHYQPKIHSQNRQLAGFEALLRWEDPERGLVSPAEFVPVLEETGLIVDVGEWVIRQVLRDYHSWSQLGWHPPRIAVNVSVKQLQRADFLNRLRSLVSENPAGPDALELEITESLIMKNVEATIQTLKAVQEMGITVAIDDFGTGYSSLSYIARLPVDALKIDRSFISSMTEEAASMGIVSSIISLAHSLDLKVVAEGVETDEHARFLKLLKCDEMQGYLFGRPMPREQIMPWHERHLSNG